MTDLRKPEAAAVDRGIEPPLLAVEGLTVEFPTESGWRPVVQDLSFEVSESTVLGLVGESGSGKTVTAQAVMGLTRRTGGHVSAGRILYGGCDLLTLKDKEMRARRGREIAMIFQQASRSLNPAYTVGDQIAETVRHHLGLSRRASVARSVELLDRVKIPNAERRHRDYPHQFSGGMLQRVMIAIAISCGPKLLLADEPTTALDVTVQATILALLDELRREMGLSIVFVSHDLGVIAELCERVVVMYAGEVVEVGATAEVFRAPRHPYTSGLLGSIPVRGVSNRLVSIAGQVPSPDHLPPGCRFAPRCLHARSEVCDAAHPEVVTVGAGHVSRCARTDEIVLPGVV